MIGNFKLNILILTTNTLHHNFYIHKLLENFENYQELSRKHDIADAVCMIIFRFAKHKEKFRLTQVDKSLPFDCFIYQKCS